MSLIDRKVVQRSLKGGVIMSVQLKNAARKMKKVLKSTRGQGLVEYALILVLIAVTVIVAVRTVGNTTKTVFENVNTNMK
jgi:pilus assembly protein Flp/PilA